MTVQVFNANSVPTSFAFGSRPLARQTKDGKVELVTNQQGYVMLQTRNGLRVNSFLRKDEWEELDRAIIEATHNELNAIQHLRDAGLVQQLGGIGTMVSQYNVASEKREASVSMSLRTAHDHDRVDTLLRGVPVPVIAQNYEIGARELDAARRLGNALDTVEAMESGRQVAEKLESIFFNGESSIVLGGDGIDGLTNTSARLTDTANNFGGGDWGTQANVKATVLGMIAGLSARGYRGPYRVYAANTQYFEALDSFAEKPGSPLSEVEALPQVLGLSRSDFLADGNIVVVQMTRSVVDLAIGLEIANREWNAQDDSAFYGKVLGVMVPRIKVDVNDETGIAHATGA